MLLTVCKNKTASVLAALEVEYLKWSNPVNPV